MTADGSDDVDRSSQYAIFIAWVLHERDKCQELFWIFYRKKKSGSPTQFSIPFCVPVLLGVLWGRLCVWFGGRTSLETLFEIVYDIVDVFNTDGDADHVLCDTRVGLLLV